MNSEHDKRPSGKGPSGPSAGQSGAGRAADQSDPNRSGAGGVAGETMSRVAEGAQQVRAQAQEAASSLGSRATEKAKSLADRQLTTGADIVSDVAEAIRAAAERLDRSEPQIAQLARGAAERIEDLSDTIRNQSAEELWQASADLARRRPAVVFGATAALGFLLARLLNPRSDRHIGGGKDPREFEWDEHSDEWDRPSSRGPAADLTGVAPREPARGQVHGT